MQPPDRNKWDKELIEATIQALEPDPGFKVGWTLLRAASKLYPEIAIDPKVSEWITKHVKEIHNWALER